MGLDRAPRFSRVTIFARDTQLRAVRVARARFIFLGGRPCSLRSGRTLGGDVSREREGQQTP
jgi:hypothetical protein